MPCLLRSMTLELQVGMSWQHRPRQLSGTMHVVNCVSNYSISDKIWKTPQVRKALRDRTNVDAAEPPLKRMKGKNGPPKAVCGKARGKGGKGKKGKGKAAELKLDATAAEPMANAQVAVGTNDTKPVENAQVAVGTSDTKPVENAQVAVGTSDTKPVENAQVAVGTHDTEPVENAQVGPGAEPVDDGAVASEGDDADPAHVTGVNNRQLRTWVETVSRIRIQPTIK